MIDLDFAERSIPAADPRLYPILTQFLDDMLQAMPPEDAFLASVRRTVSDALRHGAPDLDEVARGMAIGGRTLQRRLTEAE